jgi:hypothetical protein
MVSLFFELGGVDVVRSDEGLWASIRLFVMIDGLFVLLLDIVFFGDRFKLLLGRLVFK